MRTLAIGDIHGCSRALHALLAAVDPRPEDVMVTLGDYVDRGPDSSGVIDCLVGMFKRCQVIPLLGNHDLMMRDARSDLAAFEEWVRAGGAQTLASYYAGVNWRDFQSAIPPHHWHFLDEVCIPYHEIDTHFFVHANAYPDLPLDEQPDYMLFWERLSNEVAPHESGKTMICGHTQQRSGRPLHLGSAICIDTWVYGDGWLTCLDVKKEAYWQANQRGETRTGLLDFRDR